MYIGSIQNSEDSNRLISYMNELGGNLQTMKLGTVSERYHAWAPALEAGFNYALRLTFISSSMVCLSALVAWHRF